MDVTIDADGAFGIVENAFDGTTVEQPENPNIDFKVVYIMYVGTDQEGQNIYHFFLSENCEETWMEAWSDYPSGINPRDKMDLDPSQYEYIMEAKCPFKLELAQDSLCYSMQDVRDGILALAYESLDGYEAYPEPYRVVIKFGQPMSEVDEILFGRGVKAHYC